MTWILIKLLVSVFSFPIMLLNISKYNKIGTQFVLFLIWFRYVVQALYEYTNKTIVSTFSFLALSTLAFSFIGLALIRKNTLRLIPFIPVIVFMGTVVISGTINSQIVGTIDTFTKWLFFGVVTLLLFESLNDFRLRDITFSICICLITPIILQLLSIFLGYGKSIEAGGFGDGSTSYIGGYYHEAVFSVIIFTFSCSLLMFRDKSPLLFTLLFLLSIFLILKANYRTTILASVPLIFFFLASFSVKYLKNHAVIYILIVILLLPLLAILQFSNFDLGLQNRFSDLVFIVEKGSKLIKPPDYYTEADQDILSSRAYIWSNYLDKYFNGNVVNWMWGYGPSSWKNYFVNYAHNTYISYLFEFGFIGLLAMLSIWFVNFLFALRLIRTEIGISLLLIQAGFFILNMGTIPLWQIEGLILFAIITSFTWYNYYILTNPSPNEHPN